MQDGMWRENMVKVNEDVTVLKVVEIPNLLESYKEQHELLEQVQCRRALTRGGRRTRPHVSPRRSLTPLAPFPHHAHRCRRG